MLGSPGKRGAVNSGEDNSEAYIVVVMSEQGSKGYIGVLQQP